MWAIHPMKDFLGISSATERRINCLGMHSIKELDLSSVEMLWKKSGVLEEEIHQHVNGMDCSRISDVYIPSSH